MSAGKGFDTGITVIVGSGSAGVTVAESILKLSATARVVLYGEEPESPYNRLQLSLYLAGLAKRQNLKLSDLSCFNDRLQTRFGCRVSSVDTKAWTVLDENGGVQLYDNLVLATGSRPHIPNISGIYKDGVCTFRNLYDVNRLMHRRNEAKNIVIISGGLLGLEAAKAMHGNGASIVVVEHNSYLMFNQLDSDAGALLGDNVVAMGIKVMLSERMLEVEGGKVVSSLKLANGLSIACDTLIIAAGIRANVDLALRSGLAINRGNCVDDQLQISKENVYVVSECAEHNGIIYGLVAPGFEQAKVLAHVLASKQAAYKGSVLATKLKVVGVSVFSMGSVGAASGLRYAKEYSFVDIGGVYRKIVIHRDCLVGAIAVGAWPELARVQESLSRRRRLRSWQLHRFMRSGNLWPPLNSSVENWPANAIVCNCNNVSRIDISRSIKSGCDSIEKVSQHTRASTVFGSCRSLVLELLGSKPVQQPSYAFRWLVAVACMALLLI